MSSTPRQLIAVVDDDPTVAHLLRGMLNRSRYFLISAMTGAAGLDLIRARKPQVVLLDSVLPDAYGADVLRQIVDFDPQLPVIFVQTRTDGPATIAAAKSGAFDFLSKPLDPDLVRTAVQRAAEQRNRNADEAFAEGSQRRPLPHAAALVGSSPAMLEVFRAIGRFARTTAPVLLIGERGVGKEAIAREIHRNSELAAKPFLTLHCPAYDADQLAAQLFDGSQEGAGLWSQAAGGTLVLQEIQALPLAQQTNLLARLQPAHNAEGASTSRLPRVIAATSADLSQLAAAAAFRSDLYYLLSAGEIAVAPLRQRQEDIAALAEQFLSLEEGSGQQSEPARLADEAIQLLVQQPWPGNCDELQGVIRRAVLQAPGALVDVQAVEAALIRRPMATAAPVTKEDSDWFLTNWRQFVDDRLQAGTAELYSECLAEAERKLLVRLLQHTRGNQSKASQMLGISRASLRKKLRALGVSASTESSRS